MTEEQILIILIVIVAACMLYIYGSSETYLTLGAVALANAKVGGDIEQNNKEQNSKEGGSALTRKLIVADNAKFVIDGNNLVHAITGKPHMTPKEFETGLRSLSWSLSNALPGKDLHVVLKNPKAISKTEDIKKVEYFQHLINLSREFPAITYHLAYGHDTKKAKDQHYLKGRDDFLTLYLARSNGYIISQDRYKDFNKFTHIKPFFHFATANGNIVHREKINPQGRLLKADKPTIGNHIMYRFISKQDLLKNPNINNGDIYVDNVGENSYINLLI